MKFRPFLVNAIKYSPTNSFVLEYALKDSYEAFVKIGDSDMAAAYGVLLQRFLAEGQLKSFTVQFVH